MVDARAIKQLLIARQAYYQRMEPILYCHWSLCTLAPQLLPHHHLPCMLHMLPKCRIGSPDSPASQHSRGSTSFKSSRSLKQSKSTESRPGTSGSSQPASRAQGRRPAAAPGAAAAAAGQGLDAGAAEVQAHGAHRNKRTGAAVSFAVAGDAGDSPLEEQDSSTAGDGEEGQQDGSEGSGMSPRAGGRSARGVKVGKKGVGIVVAAAKNAGKHLMPLSHGG